MSAPADTPTETEVVYSHVDIKLHPLRLQLDTALLVALAAFFKVKAPGAARDRGADGRALDKSLGLSAIERAGARFTCPDSGQGARDLFATCAAWSDPAVVAFARHVCRQPSAPRPQAHRL